jgi:surfactin synthase thioesterase subunit
MAAAPGVICKDPRDAILIAGVPIKLRVICVPQAGMGAWAFHGWQRAAPTGCEILPVELPGRNSRFSEPKPTAMGPLVTSLANELDMCGAFNSPFVLLGHSLGAWIAFELAAELLRRGARAPSLLIVSAVRPPHMHSLEHDADRVSPGISAFDGPEFWSHFERRYGRNPDLAEESVRALILPLLRADFGILESYAPSRGAEPLPCPLVACSAAGDGRVLPGQLAAWQSYAKDGEFREESFSATPLPWSTPHRYLIESPGALQAMLARECTALLRKLEEPQPLEPAPAAAAPPAAEGTRMTVAELLVSASCSAHAALFGDCTVTEWVALLDSSGRPAFLRMLSERGVARLAERQAIANALGRARRENKV